MLQRHPVIRQVYVVGAVLAFVGTFMPLFATDTGESLYETMNLWSAIVEDGGGPAGLGVVVVLAMVATALRATRAERSFGAPGGVLFLAFVAVVMLLLKPGTGSDAPSLGAGGSLLLGTALVLAATALADVLMTPRQQAPISLPG